MIAVAYRKNGAYSTIDTDSTNRLRSDLRSTVDVGTKDVIVLPNRVMHRIPCMSQDNTTNHPITDIGTPPTHPHVPYWLWYGSVRYNRQYTYGFPIRPRPNRDYLTKFFVQFCWMCYRYLRPFGQYYSSACAAS